MCGECLAVLKPLLTEASAALQGAKQEDLVQRVGAAVNAYVSKDLPFDMNAKQCLDFKCVRSQSGEQNTWLAIFRGLFFRTRLPPEKLASRALVLRKSHTPSLCLSIRISSSKYVF